MIATGPRFEVERGTHYGSKRVAPPAPIDEVANRAADLHMTYGDYIASQQYKEDKEHYFPFKQELKRATARRKDK